MRKTDTFHSRVYENRPSYADLPAPAKFQAIHEVIRIHVTRLLTDCYKSVEGQKEINEQPH